MRHAKATASFSFGRIALFAVLSARLVACGDELRIEPGGAVAGWPEYGGDAGGTRYSPLAQIPRPPCGGTFDRAPGWRFVGALQVVERLLANAEEIVHASSSDLTSSSKRGA